MLKNKYIKIFASSFLVLMALWVATPKVYVHNLLNHNHSVDIDVNGESKLQQKNSDDCDFEKYNTPSYFNVFKFLNSFVPDKPQSIVDCKINNFSLVSISSAIYLLRAPPITA
ncbi:MAG: hypothetical protein SFY56_15350 [Bacteroidota bacterium]|nr:hypothetical protein [Bacteroidota bacterium]